MECTARKQTKSVHTNLTWPRIWAYYVYIYMCMRVYVYYIIQGLIRFDLNTPKIGSVCLVIEAFIPNPVTFATFTIDFGKSG